MKPTLVDTNLLVDWCLWRVADDIASAAEVGSFRFRALRLSSDLVSFEQHLRGRRVLIAEHTLVEAGARLHRLLSHEHRGSFDRKNEPMLGAALAFLETFGPELRRVTARDTQSALKLLNRREGARPVDLGDAALVAALPAGARLATADRPLRDRCHAVGRAEVILFDEGRFRGLDGLPLRER